MGLLDFIFGKKQMIEDDFFGSMLFMGNNKNPRLNYFECRRNFKPNDKEIEIGIEGDISGPNDIQKIFFKEIEINYDTIIVSIQPKIEEVFQNWKEDFKIIDFYKEFEPVYIFIPKCDNKNIEWEIAFESEHDRNHTFSISMIGFQAQDLQIDG